MNKLLSGVIAILTFWVLGCEPKADVVSDNPIDYDEWKLIAHDGTRLYVKEFGEGDTVIVIHGGFGAEHGYMINAFMPLANQYHFVLYDQRGSLRSKCADSLVTVANHIKDIESLREGLGLKQMTVVGHSMGGYLAMRYTSEYADNVKKLILLSSPPAKCNIDSLTTKIQEPTLARWKRKDVIAELQKYGVEEAGNKSYTDKQKSLRNRITFGAINLHDVTNWREIKGGPLFFSGSASSASSKSMESDNWNFITELKKQELPIYILHGDDDYLPYTYHSIWKDSVSTNHFYLIKDAGHCLWIDNLKEYKQVMNKIL